jgi:hypothetical protein
LINCVEFPLVVSLVPFLSLHQLNMSNLVVFFVCFYWDTSRRSGLQDNLTANELRRLTDKLKKRATGKGEHGEVIIDYEKYVLLAEAI